MLTLRLPILAFAVFSLGLMPHPASARVLHKKHHHVTDIYAHHRGSRHGAHRAKHHVKAHKAHSSQMVRTAQIHLINMNYYKGKADGMLGPKTAAAITKFQHDYHIHMTGKLTSETYNAIIKADAEKRKAIAMADIATNTAPPPPAPDFYATHPDFYGHYDQAYADPLQNARNASTGGGTQAIVNRYAKIEAIENIHGIERDYTVMLNGEPLVVAEDQPAVIGISQTFALGDEDAIIFSTYRSNSTICAFKHYLLTVRADGTNMQEIGNCTRGYQAKLEQGSLYVIFPETDDGRAVGDTWRYEPGDLEKL